METHSLKPFYVGQEVVAVANHQYGLFKKGDTFIVTGIFKPCCCWRITIGIQNPTRFPPVTNCMVCGKATKDKSQLYEFNVKWFAPIISNFEAISFEKVLEQELSSKN